MTLLTPTKQGQPWKQHIDEFQESLDGTDGHTHNGSDGQGPKIDSDEVAYIATTVADWDAATDPGDVEQALDQLAERTKDLELSIGAWAAWNPTLGAVDSMTYTSTSLTYARYCQIGSTVFFAIAFTGTVGGTLSNAVTFTAPVAPATIAPTQPAQVIEGTTKYIGVWIWDVATSKIEIQFTDGSNFGAGTVATKASGFYEVA